MIKFNVFALIAVAVCLSFLSCNSETETIDTATFGYGYFPLKKGNVWVYASDSIIFTNGGARKDTFHALIMEEIGDPFLDLSGDTIYKLNRFFKRNEADPWQRINTWTIQKNKSNAISTDENIKFVKMVFPVKEGLRFDGNVYVNEDLKVEVGGEMLEPYDSWNHQIKSLATDITYKDKTVKSLHVNLVDETSIIDRRKADEYYADGIGLVKKEITILDSDGSKPNDPWETKAKKGFIHTLTLIDHK